MRRERLCSWPRGHALAPVRKAIVFAAAFLASGCGGTGEAQEQTAPEYAPEVAPHAAALASEDVQQRIAAARALAAVEHADAIEVLGSAFGDASPQVRRWVAWALGEKSDLHAAIELIEALDDPDASVRCAAVAALGGFSSAKLTAHIANRLADPSRAVQFEAAFQLALRTDDEFLCAEQKRIVPLAMGLLDAPNLPLAGNAAVILRRISGKPYGAELDWLDAAPAQRSRVLEQWKAWYEQWQQHPADATDTPPAANQ